MQAKLHAAQFILLFTAASVFAAVPVDFYATVSTSQDTNMISMTTDLFFTQFQSLDGYSVTDKRATPFDPSTAAPSAISFYAEIQESGDGSWLCTLNAIKTGINKNISETKKYASYYKILLDAKASLENLLASLDGSDGETSLASSSITNKTTTRTPSAGAVSVESLAGTWTGEPLVDKILILRGGKGFIIFKNGASMNITLSIQGSTVNVKQSGKSNASFFPDLPRTVALQIASTAEPVEWSLSLVATDILQGTKKTLVTDDSSATGASYGSVEVEWKKK